MYSSLHFHFLSFFSSPSPSLFLLFLFSLLFLLLEMGSHVAQAGLKLLSFLLPHSTSHLLCIQHSLPEHVTYTLSPVKNDLSPLSACAQLASLLEAGRSRMQ